MQKMLIDALSAEVAIDDEISCLAAQTKKRRKPNISTILKFIIDEVSDEELSLSAALKNVKG